VCGEPGSVLKFDDRYSTVSSKNIRNIPIVHFLNIVEGGMLVAKSVDLCIYLRLANPHTMNREIVKAHLIKICYPIMILFMATTRTGVRL